ncbi:quinon protein alcohol dehydrogenase-like superfamily [Mycena vulgaris]|nr:quinon protein alcohol dehydrogenase-like superfamily [Mycena vulgaris]
MELATPHNVFKAWEPLADDFQQNGVPAAYATEPWISEVGRLQFNRDDICIAALSPDNARSAAVVERKICVFTASTGELLHTLRGHAGYIRALEFHPGGRKLASGSSINGQDREELVRVWELDRDGAGRAFSGTLPNFEAGAFSCDGQSLLYLPNRTTVAVLDVATLTERFRLAGHTDAVVWAETSPNNSVIATSSWDETVRLWSMASGETLHILRGETNQSWACAFPPECAVIAAGAGNGSVRIWHVDTGELLPTLDGFRGWVRSLAFSPDGRHLAAGASRGTLRVFNVGSGESEQKWQIKEVRTPMQAEVRCVQYTARGDLFYSSTERCIFGYRESQNSKWEVSSESRDGMEVS